MSDETQQRLAAPYVQQGIASAKAGNTTDARQQLAQAIALDPRCEQAWLWLSGLHADPEQRRSCLEQVLRINPQNAAAQRGLAMLGGANAQATPPARSIIRPLAGENDTLSARALDQAAAPEPPPVVAATVPTLSMPSIAQPDPTPAPVAAPTLILPSVAQADTPPYAQRAVDRAIRGLASHLEPDQICRTLCDEFGYSWQQAQEIVEYVQTHQHAAVARRQSPFMIIFGVAILLGGIALFFGCGYLLIRGYSGGYRMISLRGSSRLLSFVGTGFLMIIGGISGTIKAIRSAWK
ncbi:hypothetical protein F8S13_01050 [Chloroflexia bacterium SDU3-3]|nr:hypothetical protein F8S13_01050 [Chloroflexia bacterium SDU3-3]